MRIRTILRRSLLLLCSRLSDLGISGVCDVGRCRSATATSTTDIMLRSMVFAASVPWFEFQPCLVFQTPVWRSEIAAISIRQPVRQWEGTSHCFLMNDKVNVLY